jgi:uncharacterized protein (DUF427 family)
MRAMNRCGPAARIACVESVWEYPRSPAVMPCLHRVRLELGGQVLADSTRALRVLETSHPPTVYVPLGDVRSDLIGPFKGPPGTLGW